MVGSSHSYVQASNNGVLDYTILIGFLELNVSLIKAKFCL